MKRLFLLFATVLCLCAGNKAMAYDFFAVNNDGDTIYYNITSPTPPLTVAVTNNGDSTYSGDITIPDNVTDGGNTYSVTAIGDEAFSFCHNLTSIIIPNSVITLEYRAFGNCSGLASVTIPNSVISIGNNVFLGCSGLASVTIGDSVMTIGNYAFAGCGFTSVTIPNSVTTIGGYAFSSCDLISATIGNSVMVIGERAFILCLDLTSVTIGNSVTIIGDYAFALTGLTSVTIPNSVTTIGELAFADCSDLAIIYVEAKVPPSVGNNAFMRVSNTIPVYVPCGKETVYKNAEEWNYFTNITEDCISVKDIYTKHEITLSPNPATDNISITLPENVHSAVFMLYDMQGKVLIKQKISNQETVPIDKLASGVYIYNVETNKQNHQGKLIKK
jgi:hypothetical protein